MKASWVENLGDFGFEIVTGAVEELGQDWVSAPVDLKTYDTAKEAWAAIEERVNGKGYQYTTLPDAFRDFVEDPKPRACWLKR